MKIKFLLKLFILISILKISPVIALAEPTSAAPLAEGWTKVTHGSEESFTTPCASPPAHLFRSGSLVNDYCTIQEAIDASEDGDSIYVDAGTYTEQLTITSGIVLQGAGKDQTIIQSPDSDNLVVNGGWKTLKDKDMLAVIGIKTDNTNQVKINGLTVDGMDQGYLPDATYPDKMAYAFQGIGAINTNLLVDDVKVTRVRALATDYSGTSLPVGYLPTDQPSGMNHNDAIFAESADGAGEHTLEISNTYIDKFQKDAILAWGPTLTVNIHDNTIQGYGQTLWSTGNGIQIASSNLSSGDRRGTKGAITNNQILDIGLVIPEEGEEGSYLNLGMYSSSCILLWEVGAGFEISGNTISRTIGTKSWHVDFTSTDGGYGSVGVAVVSSEGTVVKDNTISGYDEAVTAEQYLSASSLIVGNNSISNNTIDYGIATGPNNISLGNDGEVLMYYTDSPGNDTISNFAFGDTIQIVNLITDVINGMLGVSPSIDYSSGTITAGDGTNVPALSMQVQTGDTTYLYLDTDNSAGAAELKLILTGQYLPENFYFSGPYIVYQYAAPVVATTNISTFDASSGVAGGEVTANGGASVTERGVVYSSSDTDPLIGETNVIKAISDIATGTGVFSDTITGLSEKTTYYVKAYAINSVDTSYGSEETFTTPCAVPSVHLYSSNSLVDNYCTIQEAIDASEDGDSIYVDAGTYTEQLTITSGIVLQGAGKDQTIIQSPNSASLAITGGNWKTLKDQDPICIVGIKSTNDVPVTIRGLKVDGQDQGQILSYPDENNYDFIGIGAFNTTVTVDDVYVTGVRNLASDYADVVLPSGYTPADQPSGMNHNSSVFAESSVGAGEHTFTITNSYIDKFQKTAILAWGPTLTVDINNNTIQGYGQTLWSTGNGIQIASSDRTGSGGANGDRRGTKGSISNNQILDMGLVIPEEGEEGSYLNLGMYSSSCILLWEVGAGFEISGNTISRTIGTKSWHVDFTSTDGGYGSVGVIVVSSEGTVVKDNTISGYDEAVTAEQYLSASSLIVGNNSVSNNTIDYGIATGPNNISLGNDGEVLMYYTDSPGNDTISNFAFGDTIQIVNLITDVINGMLGVSPSIDYSSGTITAGDGTNVPALSMQVQTGDTTYLYLDTDNSAGAAELKLILTGQYLPENFYFSGPYIVYQYTTPELTTAAVTTPEIISATLGGEVTFDGGTTVTERGVVYNTTGTPTTTSGAKVQIGSGTGSFSKSVTGLTASTTYYVRAYAINSEGISYGNEESFTTQDKETQTMSFSGILAKTYGDASFTLGDETTDKGLTVTYTATDPTVVSISGNEAIILKVGTTMITATQAGNDTIAAATPVEQNLVVDKKALTITAKDTTKVYDGAVFSGFKVVYSGFISGEDETDLSGGLAFSGNATTATDAGVDYVITPGGLTSSNYTISFVDGSLEITAKPITVTADEAQAKVYGESDPVFTYGFSPALVGTDAFTGALTRVAGEDVGTYAIEQGTLAAGDNYTIAYVGKDFEITAKPITVTVDESQNKVYGESDPVFTYAFSPALVGTDAFTGSLTRVAGEDVGTYAIEQGTLAAGDNYTIAYVGKDFEITAKPITVTADEAQAKVYGESDPTLTYGVSPGLVGTDAFTGALTRVAGEDVGTYAIEQGTLAAGDNYTIAYVGKDFEITAKPIKVTADEAQAKVYGESDPTLTYGVSPGLVGTDAFTGALTRVAGEDVGTYAIEQGTLAAGDNYTIAYVGKDFEITAKPITVTADEAQAKVYGESDPVFTYGFSPALVGTDAFTGALTRVAGEDVGTYAIEQGTLAAGDNYTIAYVGKDFEITAKPITVTADESQNKIYGESDPVFTYVFSPALVGTDAFTGSLTRVAGEDVGTYAIEQGTLAAGDNYTITYVSKDFEIMVKALTVTADDKTKEYDGTVYSGFTVSYSGFVNEEDENILGGSLTFSGSATTSTDAGSDYVITPGGLTSDNYAITFVNGALSIAKATQVITFYEIPLKHLETDSDFNLDATSSSGLALTYSYTYTATPVPAEVSVTGYVSLLASGEVEITASQEGDNNYLPAEPVTRTMTIESSDATIHSITINGITYDTPDQEIYYLIDCNNEQNKVAISFETEANATENTALNFEIETPAPGIYRKEIHVTSQDGTETINYHIIIERSFSFDDIVIQKYNNVLIVNNNPETNGGYSFVSYQWYKDGVQVGTGQYYSAGENSDDLLDENAHYSVKITTEDGEELQTCDFTIEMNIQATLAVSPNPAVKGNMVNISTTYSPEVLSTREVVIKNISGEVLYREVSPENNSRVTLPPTLAPGTYIISTQAGGIILSSKLIVQ